MRAGAIRLWLYVLIAASLASWRVFGQTAANRTPVEVWCGGDDGLTQRLFAALQITFQSSPHFTLSTGRKPGTLVATIPTNVEWRQIGRRTLVSYTVDFTSTDNLNLGVSKGSCWDNSFAKCAAKIVLDAELAARKIH